MAFGFGLSAWPVLQRFSCTSTSHCEVSAILITLSSEKPHPVKNPSPLTPDALKPETKSPKSRSEVFGILGFVVLAKCLWSGLTILYLEYNIPEPTII